MRQPWLCRARDCRGNNIRHVGGHLVRRCDALYAVVRLPALLLGERHRAPQDRKHGQVCLSRQAVAQRQPRCTRLCAQPDAQDGLEAPHGRSGATASVVCAEVVWHAPARAPEAQRHARGHGGASRSCGEQRDQVGDGWRRKHGHR
eukprot:Mycagemm_TRINITY_DN10332_c2_g3::TRINITY_DN10332_c2_g3_i1::g.684::m.684 type:complete len:146 gc:universal TRINITY_DN10332_c2_g3_i1:589-1026(+)